MFIIKVKLSIYKISSKLLESFSRYRNSFLREWYIYNFKLGNVYLLQMLLSIKKIFSSNDVAGSVYLIFLHYFAL